MQNSHFKFLMKTIGMTEQELADILSVDKTLVNKWKNGKRDFAPSTPYFEAVVEALIKRSATLTPDVLASTFKSTGKELISKVAAYLAEPDAPAANLSLPEDGIKVPLVLFDGCESRCQAFAYFTREAGKYENENIYLVLTQDMTCNGNDRQCVSMVVDFIKHSLARSKSINLIFRYSDPELFDEQLILLATLSLNKNLNIYVRFTGKEVMKQSYFIIGKKLAMFISSNSQKPVLMQFLIYENDRFCEFQTRRYRAELSASVEFVSKYTLGGSHNLISEIADISVSSAPMYIHGRYPCFFAMDEPLLYKILAANDISKARADSIVRLHNDFKRIYLKNVAFSALHEIYDLDGLTEILKEKNFYSPFLSMLAKKMIVVPRRLYSEYFSGLLAFLNSNKKADIYLLSPSVKDADHSFIYIIKQYSFALAGAGVFTRNNILFTKNMVSVSLLYDFFLAHYGEIPRYMDTNEATIGHFMRLLTLFKE